MKINVLLLLMVCVLILVSGCSGYKKIDKIQAVDYFSKIKGEIPIEIPSALPTSEYLHTDENVEELKSKLDEISNIMGNFITESLPHNALMIVYSENAKNALYLLHEYPSGVNGEPKYEHQYRFSDFSSSLHIDVERENGYIIRQIKGIPIPHHLFEEMSSGNYYENEKILIRDDINKFYEFYQIFKKYYPYYSMEVEIESNKLILKNIPVSIEIEDDKGVIQNKSSQLKEVIFTFSKSGNEKPVITISYIT